MKNYCILFVIILIFSNGSCSKYDCHQPGVPDATQEGKNISGCAVNEIVVRPTRSFGYPASHRLSYEKDTGRVFLSLRETFYSSLNRECGLPYELEVRIAAYNVFNTGKIKSDDIYATVRIINTDSEQVNYRYRAFLDGLSANVEITRLDTVEKIASGTFDFEAYKEIDNDEFNLNKKVYVTNGIFDFKY